MRVYKSFYGWLQPYVPSRHDEMLRLGKGYIVEVADEWWERHSLLKPQWDALWKDFKSFPICRTQLHTTVTLDDPKKEPHPRENDGEGIVLDSVGAA